MLTNNIFKSWVRMKNIWVNTSIMVHNSRAVAQLARHRVEDKGDKADRANQRFLAQVSPGIAEKFDFFRKLLGNLGEGITEDEYRGLLAEYLNQFLEAAERN